MQEVVGEDVGKLLTFLKESRGFDFTGYKRPSLQRRIAKRMQLKHIASYDDYIEYLKAHEDEYRHLFDTILINVTSFFRDPEAWEYVANTTLPVLLSSKKDGDPIRVWSAGCASGEEAYTVAMLLAERLGPEEFRDKVKIYATDLDEGALNQSRAASFQLAGLAHPGKLKTCRRNSSPSISKRAPSITCSIVKSVARSSSAGTISPKMRRSPASIFLSAETR